MAMIGKVKNFFNKDECERYYKLGKTLGQGSFATVKSAQCKQDNSMWAVKIIRKVNLGPEDEEALQTEVDILQKIDHPHVVKLREVFDCAQNFYMVMEMCTGGELFDRIVEKEHYNESEARDCIIAVTKALKYCHSHNIVHRDLKPENLLYSDDTDAAELKLADFGLAKLLDTDTMLHTACGTPGYVAPEILEGKAYGKEVDLWSVGVISYILLCGFPPFYDDNNAALFRQIKSGVYEYPSPFWDDVSAKAKNLIDMLLVLDPTKRATCDDVLNHPYITEGLENRELPHFQEQLRQYNVRRKFRAGIMTLQAVQFLGHFKPESKKEG